MNWLRTFEIDDWIGPVSRTIPTTDLYFLNACRQWLHRPPFNRGPIRREGANSFTCGDAIIISRRDDDDVIRRLLQQRGKRLYYIIDDDLWAAEADTTLPVDYRQKLIALREGQHRMLAEQADTIVVSSLLLADLYSRRGHQVVVLDPYWSEPMADNSHFDNLTKGAPLEIGYLGSGSHAIDRSFVMAIFEELTRKQANIRLTIIGTSEVPDRLSQHPKLRILKPLPWPRHRKRLARLQLHMLLYPVLPTAFNKARSLNKLIEHSILGGVGVYSQTWRYADIIEKGKAGLLPQPTPKDWARDISSLSTNKLMLLKNNHTRLAASLNNKGNQIRFWKMALEKQTT